MKTADIPVYGNIVVYIQYCAVCLKIDYTLQCLEYIGSVSSPLRRQIYSNYKITNVCIGSTCIIHVLLSCIA